MREILFSTSDTLICTQLVCRVGTRTSGFGNSLIVLDKLRDAGGSPKRGARGYQPEPSLHPRPHPRRAADRARAARAAAMRLLDEPYKNNPVANINHNMAGRYLFSSSALPAR